jgi:phage-related holin
MSSLTTLPLWSIVMKYSFQIKMSILLSIPTWCITKFTEWTISNKDFIACVLLCIAIDHILGSLSHAFKLKDFSFKKNTTGILKKISICVLSIVLFEVMHFIVHDLTSIYDYLKVVTRMTVISYPVSSAFINMAILTNGKFPPKGWLEKLKYFNETLNLKR